MFEADGKGSQARIYSDRKKMEGISFLGKEKLILEKEISPFQELYIYGLLTAIRGIRPSH